MYKYQKDNPECEVSLQANEEMLEIKETIKYAGKKALINFLSIIASHENDKSQ